MEHGGGGIHQWLIQDEECGVHKVRRLATACNGRGRDVITLFPQVFSQGHGESLNLEFRTRALPLAGDRLGRGEIFDEM